MDAASAAQMFGDGPKIWCLKSLDIINKNRACKNTFYKSFGRHQCAPSVIY